MKLPITSYEIDHEVVTVKFVNNNLATTDKTSDPSDNLTFAQLHRANVTRQAEWLHGAAEAPSISYRGNELAGEVGELCNIIKKLERERMRIRGSRAQLSDVADEAADVIMCVELICADLGIDLGAAVRKKFNATSVKYKLTTTMESANADS